jgi:hypothetical protein
MTLSDVSEIKYGGGTLHHFQILRMRSHERVVGGAVEGNCSLTGAGWTLRCDSDWQVAHATLCHPGGGGI